MGRPPKKQEEAEKDQEKEQETEAASEEMAVVNVWDDPKTKLVPVRFLVDYTVDGRLFKCGVVTPIPEVFAKAICDNRSVEFVK